MTEACEVEELALGYGQQLNEEDQEGDGGEDHRQDHETLDGLQPVWEWRPREGGVRTHRTIKSSTYLTDKDLQSCFILHLMSLYYFLFYFDNAFSYNGHILSRFLSFFLIASATQVRSGSNFYTGSAASALQNYRTSL